MLGWREVELLIPKTESRQVLISSIFENSSVCFHVRILLVCSKIHLYTLCTSWSWSWLLGVLHSPSLPSLVGCTLRFSLCFLSLLLLTLRCDRQRMCRLDGGWNFWFHKLLTTAYSKQVLNSLLLLRFYARKSIFCNLRLSWFWSLNECCFNQDVLHSPSPVSCRLMFSLWFLGLTLRRDRQRMYRLDGGWNFRFRKLTTAHSKQVSNSMPFLRFYVRRFFSTIYACLKRLWSLS